jgi:hypothetical protein
MALVQRGEASFVADDGVTYRLVMDFAAFAEAEDAAGMGVDALLAAVDPKIDPETGKPTRVPRLKHIGALLYGALAQNHPGLTPRDALNLLGSSEEAGAALGKAMEGAMPKPDPSAEGNAPGLRGIGTTRKSNGRRKV